MNKFLGYSLTTVGLLGFTFFLKYQGTMIPLRELWFVLSIFIMVVGAYFLAKYKLHRLNKQRSNSDNKRLARIEHLKRVGHKVRVTLDNAEVKTRSYCEEIISDSLPSRIEIADALYDSNRNYKTREIEQTYLLFYKVYNGKLYKFIGQPTMQNNDAVKRYIDRQKGIDLYIDPQNPTIYYFDMPYL